MTKLSPSLVRLGSALEDAAAADLRAARTPGRRRTRRLVLLAAALAIAVPGVAIAAHRLLTDTHSVEQSMPAGARILVGTDPTCTVVQQNVEYNCVLARRPAPEVSDFKGTVEPTTDATKHVNGGCRSLRSDGLEWECYLGQAAVDHQIIGRSFLGEFAPNPGVG